MLVKYQSLRQKLAEVKEQIKAKQNKLDEITPRLETAIRELGIIKEEADTIEKVRQGKAKELDNLDGLINGKRTLIKAINMQVLEAKGQLKGIMEPKNAIIAELKTQIVYLESVLSGLDKGLISIDDKKEELSLIKKHIEEANETLFGIKKDIDSSNNLLQGNRERSDDIKKEVEMMVKQAVSQIESAKSMLNTVDKEIKRVEFYARRLKKIYTSKGWPIPDDLGDFKSVKVILKDKTIKREKANVQ